MDLKDLIDISEQITNDPTTVGDDQVQSAARALKKLDGVSAVIKAEVKSRLESGVSFEAISYQQGKSSYEFDASKTYAGLKSFLGANFDPTLWVGTAVKVDKTSIGKFICACKDVKPTSTAGKALIDDALSNIATAWNSKLGAHSLKIDYDK